MPNVERWEELNGQGNNGPRLAHWPSRSVICGETPWLTLGFSVDSDALPLRQPRADAGRQRLRCFRLLLVILAGVAQTHAFPNPTTDHMSIKVAIVEDDSKV